MCREGCSGAGFKIDSSVSVDKVFLIEIRWDGGRMQRRSRASAHLRHGFRIISIAWCFFRSTAAARRGLFRLNGLLARATNAARACGGGGLWGVAVSGQTRIHWESSARVPCAFISNADTEYHICPRKEYQTRYHARCSVHGCARGLLLRSGHDSVARDPKTVAATAGVSGC